MKTVSQLLRIAMAIGGIGLLVFDSLPAYGESGTNITVSRDSVDFGTIEVNLTATDSLVISNTSGISFLVIDSITVTQQPVFQLTSLPLTSAIVLAAGADTTIAVAFAPSAETTYRDTIRIASDDPTKPLIEVPIFGSGYVPVTASLPVTGVGYADSSLIPLRISDTSGKGIVAFEAHIAYEDRVVPTIGTSISGSMVASGWFMSKNTTQGVSGVDTLKIAAASSDPLTGSGDLIYLQVVTANIRHPDSTALKLVHLLYNDGSPIPKAADGVLRLIGTDGVALTSPDTVVVRDSVYVSVTDIDANLDPGAEDSLQVWTFESANADSEQIWLTETGISTGDFTGGVPTLYGISGVVSDGVLSVTVGDSVGVTYVDSLGLAGTTESRQGFTDIIGGNDGTARVTKVMQAKSGKGGDRDTLRIEISDADLDEDAGSPDTLWVVVSNPASSETEAVKLAETGPSTGVFRARVPTVEGGAGTSDDGILSLTAEDSTLNELDVVYTDTVTALGNPDTLKVQVPIINMFGDVSANNSVGAFDASYILSINVGATTATSRDSLVADVDGNLSVLAFDASKVLQYVVDLIDRFAVRDTVYIDPAQKNHPFAKPAARDGLIALGEVQAEADGIYRVPVVLSDRQGIVSAGMRITYAEDLQVVGVEPAKGYESYLAAYHANAGVLRIAFAGAQPTNEGAGELMWLRIKASGIDALRFMLDEATLNGERVGGSAGAVDLAQPAERPTAFALHPNHPNPFNPTTAIRYDLPEAGNVRLVVYSALGQQVKVLVSQEQAEGRYEVVWDGRDQLGYKVGSGVYLVHFQAGQYRQAQKMLLLK